LNSDTDSFADNASYALSENGAGDDHESLQASDPLLGKSNELFLAVQEIEQIIEHKPPCFDQPMVLSSWNDEASVTLDLNENNSSSESISPTTITSFPELIVPKFLTESLKARATPQDLLAKLGLGNEIKALLKSANGSLRSGTIDLRH
jgi:hypothetical protein